MLVFKETYSPQLGVFVLKSQTNVPFTKAAESKPYAKIQKEITKKGGNLKGKQIHHLLTKKSEGTLLALFKKK